MPAVEPGQSPNPYVPLFVDLQGRRVLIVGGGKVAERKAANLIRHGVVAHVVASQASECLQSWAGEGKIALEIRDFREEDAKGCFLVFAATDSRDVNLRVKLAAKESGALVNSCDDGTSEVIIPSELSRGRLQMAISTTGASPALARRIRMEEEDRYGEEWGPYTELLYQTRSVIMRQAEHRRVRKMALEALADDAILDRMKSGEAIAPQDLADELCEEAGEKMVQKCSECSKIDDCDNAWGLGHAGGKG